MDEKSAVKVIGLFVLGAVALFLKSALDDAKKQLEEERNPRIRWTDANRWD